MASSSDDSPLLHIADLDSGVSSADVGALLASMDPRSDAEDTGDGGAVQVTAGLTSASSATGGAVSIAGGQGSAGRGGAVLVDGGSAQGASNIGGAVVLMGGEGGLQWV